MANRTARNRAPSTQPQGRLLFAAVLAVLAITPGHTQTPAAPATKAAPSTTQVPQVDLDRLKRPESSRPANDLFGSRSWEPPRVRERKAPEPAPAPVAPPLPFAFVGRWLEKGETIVVLSKESQNYIVRAGEKLDGTYVLEAVESDKLIIRYLPLDTAQVLSFATGAPAAAPRAPQKIDERARPKTPNRDADDEDE
jgi:hypothetical protein